MVTKPRESFRFERLLISPQSFELSRARRAWTWPIVAIGHALGHVQRGLAKCLRVDLHAPHERREYVSPDQAEEYVWELSWDDDEDRYFILTPTQLNRRERLLASFGRVSKHLVLIRLDWQRAQLSAVVVRNITISKRQRVVDTVEKSNAAGAVVMRVSSSQLWEAGHEIKIDVYNGNRRECRLKMVLIGSALDDRVST